MKTKSIALLAWVSSLAFVSTNAFADAVTPLVQNEYVKLQAEFQAELAKSKKTLQELEGTKRKALVDIDNQARLENGGIDSLKRYDIVIVSRYVNDQGEYQSGLEINQKDVQNINSMFETYMHSSPLFGRVSAGQARRTLEWGIARLQELSKVHSSPTEQNTSELEIIAKLQHDAETTIKTVTLLAGRLGVSLTQPIAHTAEITDPKKLDAYILPKDSTTNGRAPASERQTP